MKYIVIMVVLTFQGDIEYRKYDIESVERIESIEGMEGID